MIAPLRDAAQAAAWLEGLVLTTLRPYAERTAQAQLAVTALLAALGDPHRGLPVIHITGSKGKGSTALLLEAILRAAGLRVGTFTSPHLSHWRERFRLDGEPLDETGFAALIETVRLPVERLRRSHPERIPSFFDTATAAALWLFRDAGVDAAIVEVGLGGLWDATNVVEPRVCCITGVELEHVDKLGPTLADIARHKAGIVKPGIPVVCGPLPPPAAAVVTKTALARNAPLLQAGRDFRVDTSSLPCGNRLRYADPTLELSCELAVPGAHQALNAALAIACARQFGVPDPTGVTAAALATATLPGRCEILGVNPWLVVDGAHTVESARALRRMLDTLPAGERHWLLSFSPGKDPRIIAAELLSPGDRVILTRADPLRSQPTDQVADALRSRDPSLSLRCIDDPASALGSARTRLDSRSLLCLTGSVYMAGLGRDLLRSTRPLPCLNQPIPVAL